MAESESGADRSEEPSERRLQEARGRGQVPRSRELTTFAAMMAGSSVLVVLGESLAARLAQIMRSGLSPDWQTLDGAQALQSAMAGAAKMVLAGMAPLFGALILMVLLASVMLGGWNFSPQALAPDFSRLSPVSGLRRLFGMHGAAELGKALLKCALVGGVCAAVVWHVLRDVMALGHMQPRAAIGRGAGLLAWSFVWLCSSLALVAAVDVPLQMFQFKRNLRMTRQELRDESKETDGRPEVKQRIRQLQQTVARRRMMHRVPKADVVIVNPTHFAVAVKYDARKMRAPRVVAKGTDVVAQNIRRIAEEHRVPIFESPKLARALHRSTDLNKEIPTGLYMAVAQVLSYIFRIRSMSATSAARLSRPDPQLGAEYADV